MKILSDMEWERLDILADEVRNHPEPDRTKVFLKLTEGESQDFARHLEAHIALPPLTLVEDKFANEHIPSSIGDYRIVRKIGEGGFGTVWEAEQLHPIRRRVALKLIKFGLGSRELVVRFQSERQALAIMDHPNIARIFDGGTTDDNQPFFVMEFIEGMSLTKYCDKNKLGIDDRLKLFLDVCKGVHHAHQKGIIHRDLNPKNVIVGVHDDKPIPKVIDFGLAKAMETTQRLTDQSFLTEVGQIMGTWNYMSPEQAGSNTDIDTRTDIYSLGVVLYELITGGTPFDRSVPNDGDLLKTLELIRKKETIRPSHSLESKSAKEIAEIATRRRTNSDRLKKVLVGDLDWVVMKALDNERDRRYLSVSEFAADIQRYIDGEGVLARPPSQMYRMKKFAQRNCTCRRNCWHDPGIFEGIPSIGGRIASCRWRTGG